MTNLLPSDVKENLRSSLTARFVSFAAGALLIAAILAIMALAPSYIILKVHEARNAVSATEQATDAATAKDDLTRAQTLVSALLPLATSTTLVPTFSTFIRALPTGAVLDSISYTKSRKDGKSEIAISGTAKGREDINAYRLALDKETKFQNVYIPVSDLAGTKDGHFSVTFSGTF